MPITFGYKDYRDAARKKQMQSHPNEFVRRFSLHILPKRFVRIRHYGILSSKRKMNDLSLIHEQLDSINPGREKKDTQQISDEQSRYDPKICPCCKQQTMRQLVQFDQRGPPCGWQEVINIVNEKKQPVETA